MDVKQQGKERAADSQRATTGPTCLVVAGTVDGRLVAQALHRRGVPVIATVATDWATGYFETPDLPVHAGRLDQAGFLAFMKEHDVVLVMDCSHPYAVRVSQTVQAAATEAGALYRRYIRPSGEAGLSEERQDDHSYHLVEGTDAAIRVIRDLLQTLPQDQTILFTTGSNDLLRFAKELPPDRLVARVMPVHRSLEICEEAGLKPKQIIAMQGPFDKELNAALMATFNVGIMVTKDGGARGGFAEKIEAAAEARIHSVVIARPPDPAQPDEVIRDPEEAIETAAALISDLKDRMISWKPGQDDDAG